MDKIKTEEKMKTKQIIKSLITKEKNKDSL